MEDTHTDQKAGARAEGGIIAAGIGVAADPAFRQALDTYAAAWAFWNDIEPGDDDFDEPAEVRLAYADAKLAIRLEELCEVIDGHFAGGEVAGLLATIQAQEQEEGRRQAAALLLANDAGNDLAEEVHP